MCGLWIVVPGDGNRYLIPYKLGRTDQNFSSEISGNRSNFLVKTGKDSLRFNFRFLRRNRSSFLGMRFFKLLANRSNFPGRKCLGNRCLKKGTRRMLIQNHNSIHCASTRTISNHEDNPRSWINPINIRLF